MKTACISWSRGRSSDLSALSCMLQTKYAKVLKLFGKALSLSNSNSSQDLILPTGRSNLLQKKLLVCALIGRGVGKSTWHHVL